MAKQGLSVVANVLDLVGDVVGKVVGLVGDIVLPFVRRYRVAISNDSVVWTLIDNLPLQFLGGPSPNNETFTAFLPAVLDGAGSLRRQGRVWR